MQMEVADRMIVMRQGKQDADVSRNEPTTDPPAKHIVGSRAVNT